MPFKSSFGEISLPPSHVSLPNFLFGSMSLATDPWPAFIDTRAPETLYLTRYDYQLYSRRLAVGLRLRGFQVGERVCICSYNTIIYPVLVMGVLLAGGIITGVNPSCGLSEFSYILKDLNPRMIIASRECLGGALEATRAIAFHCGLFWFNEGADIHEASIVPVTPSHPQHWSTLLADAEMALSEEWSFTEGDSNRTAMINYTSGTTSTPKGVEITHRNHIANALHYLQTMRLSMRTVCRDRTGASKTLGVVSFGHASGQSLFLVIAFLRGIPVYLQGGRFDFLGMLKAIEQFSITDLFLAPPMVRMLALHPTTRAFDLRSLRHLATGAAALPKSIAERCLSLFPPGQVQIAQAYGLSEGTAIVALHGFDDFSCVDSVGGLAPNHEAKIVPWEGEQDEADTGEWGELWIRAPTVMKGYWNQPVATSEVMRPDGWLKTGDLCYVNATGHIFIVDRVKELLQIQGQWVAPGEVETMLMEHPAVADAAVIGITTADSTISLRAYVVLKQDSSVTAEKITSFVEEQTPSHKHLTGGVGITAALPRTAAGKLLRGVLRKSAKAEAS